MDTTLIVPGLNGSGPDHWQTWFERQLPDCIRVMHHENVDRTFLSSFGRFWATAKGHDILIEPIAWTEALNDAEATVREPPVRSLLVDGEPRVGKTSFLRILARRLEREGWSVFEAGGADLMAARKAARKTTKRSTARRTTKSRRKYSPSASREGCLRTSGCSPPRRPRMTAYSPI